MSRAQKINVDRGIQLDQMRLRGDLVDVHFVVESKRVPAHRFIVGIHSPVLRMLTLDSNANQSQDGPGPKFIDCGRDEIELHGLSLTAFESVLTYLYTGHLTINDSNVFSVIEACQFLQIEEKKLNDAFGKFLSDLVQGSCDTDVTMVLKVWCLSEQYNWSGLRETVLQVIDSKLETFLTDEIFLYLGFEELQSILSRPTLCVRSEKAVFDALVDWTKQKIDAEDDDSRKMALQLFQSLPIEQLKKSYVVERLVGVGFDRNSLKFRRSDKRTCQQCIFVTLHSRCESDIRGIDEFLEQRKSELEFRFLDLSPEKSGLYEKSDAGFGWKPMPLLTKGKTYFQHYGPREGLRGCQLVTTDSELFVFGCQKNSLSPTDEPSNDVKVFDFESEQWLRCVATLPKRLSNFGAVRVADFIYVIGGHTDCSSPARDRSSGRPSRSFGISTEVFKIEVPVLRSVITSHKQAPWITVTPMPAERTGFSVASVDDSKFFVVGRDFCDVYDVETNSWATVLVPFSAPADQNDKDRSKPVTAALGSNVYFFGERPAAGGVNGAWVLDTHSLSWTPLVPSLEMRFDPKGAFSHNGMIYLLGWQAAIKNFVHSFDPTTKKWSIVARNESGHFTNNGILTKKSYFSALQS